MRRLIKGGVVLALLVLAACDASQRVGGRFETEGQQAFLQTGVKTTVSLIVGQYAGEVAGHLLLPGLGGCTCVYFKGTFLGDTLAFVTEPGLAPKKCVETMLMSGRFTLSDDQLTGQLFQGPGWETALTDSFTLEHARTQRELTGADLRGCQE